ncbi:hypothetical protein ACIQVO_38175 [Streptomyces sp. NPDC101062]|uniref:hypothetical protein n=1 Tax=unclassified Streptomyces TaxID=2593676 RepID=UPI0038209C6C
MGARSGAPAGLLRRGIEATASVGRHVVFDADPDEVRLGDPVAFHGPLLARAVLDVLVPLKHTVALEDLLELAAAVGPLEAAVVLTTAEDVGADGCAIVLLRLVVAGPAAWPADVPSAGLFRRTRLDEVLPLLWPRSRSSCR